jgi:HPt (histidine-containing phosphotransfer) domain-containing protein
MRAIGGNLPLYRALLRDFRRDHGNTMALLRNAVLTEDFIEVRELAHTIKGLAGIFSADALAECAGDLQAAAYGDRAAVEAALERFGAAFAQMICAADAELGETISEDSLCSSP